MALLQNLIADVWKEEHILEDWRHSVICPIYKNNYRRISLLCNAYKILTDILKRKLQPYADSLIGEYQAEFRAARSTTDSIFTLKQTLEKCWEYNMSTKHMLITTRHMIVYQEINCIKFCMNFKFLQS
jgi:hypothetical protein